MASMRPARHGEKSDSRVADDIPYLEFCNTLLQAIKVSNPASSPKKLISSRCYRIRHKRIKDCFRTKAFSKCGMLQSRVVLYRIPFDMIVHASAAQRHDG